ncbi:MAG: ATP synthase subunit I [Mariprofundus sp.]
MIRLQLIFGMLGFAGLVLAGLGEFAFALLYGVVLMVANAVWLAHRLEKTRSLDVGDSQRSLYLGAVIRFVALLAGLFLAHVLNLHLLWVAGGIFLAQSVIFVCALFGFMKEQKENKGDGIG